MSNKEVQAINNNEQSVCDSAITTTSNNIRAKKFTKKPTKTYRRKTSQCSVCKMAMQVIMLSFIWSESIREYWTAIKLRKSSGERDAVKTITSQYRVVYVRRRCEVTTWRNTWQLSIMTFWTLPRIRWSHVMHMTTSHQRTERCSASRTIEKWQMLRHAHRQRWLVRFTGLLSMFTMKPWRF